MSSLPDPLLPTLEEPTDEAQISRVWGRIDARRGRRRSKAGLFLGGGALMAAAAVALVMLWPSANEPSALRRADGAAVTAMAVPLSASAPELLALDDGSEVTLEPGAELALEDNDADRFDLVLTRGRARFSVVPEGPRRWTIDSGLATIEVVGTVFSIDRSDAQVTVHVERGEVLVRGDAVPGGLRRLRAGESLTLEQATTLAAAEPVPSVEVEPERITDAPTRAEQPTAGTRRARRDEAPREVVEDAPDCRAEVLLAEADRARRDGRRGEALALLDEAARASSDSHAALAAFTRARMLLDELDRPVDARVDFERALAIGLLPRLAETARYRLIECHARAGDRARAGASARRYLARHPEGPHADGARRWLDL